MQIDNISQIMPVHHDAERWNEITMLSEMYDTRMSVGDKLEHSFYAIKCGKVRNPQLCNKYKIDDPESQLLLQDAEFDIEDVPQCYKEKSINLFLQNSYTAEELEENIQIFGQKYSKNHDKYFGDYKASAQKKVQRFMNEFKANKYDAYGCCLALTFYTGVYSQRISRDTNIVIKLDSWKVETTSKFECTKCISYWMYKALHYIPLFWGEVIRCVNLKQGQDGIYDMGNIVTWIQFSSSSFGQPTEYFSKRNTIFHIYSLSGRCIHKYSDYGNETEVLFRPLSHFLVLKKQKVGEKLYIYLRQIFFGQSQKNILWADDNIFNPKWQNKQLMQQAMKKDPHLNIIPKISTQTAMAFLKSQLCKNRKRSEFRIMSDMNRKNENPSHNAGARFAKKVIPVSNNWKMLIFTSDKSKGEKQLKQQGIVNNSNIQVTVATKKALEFLNFQ